MMKRMVRYKLKADRVAENEHLVAAVYAALQRAKPAGLRYATFKLDDGLSFLHLVAYDSEANRDSLVSLPAFKAFVAGVGERCDEAPVTTDLQTVGSYGFFEAQGQHG